MDINPFERPKIKSLFFLYFILTGAAAGYKCIAGVAYGNGKDTQFTMLNTSLAEGDPSAGNPSPCEARVWQWTGSSDGKREA
jgi:hypothetical protein